MRRCVCISRGQKIIRDGWCLGCFLDRNLWEVQYKRVDTRVQATDRTWIIFKNHFSFHGYHCPAYASPKKYVKVKSHCLKLNKLWSSDVAQHFVSREVTHPICQFKYLILVACKSRQEEFYAKTSAVNFSRFYLGCPTFSVDWIFGSSIYLLIKIQCIMG